MRLFGRTTGRVSASEQTSAEGNEGLGSRRLAWSISGLGVLVALVALTLSALPLTSDDLTQRLRREIDRRLPSELGLTIARASLGFARGGLVVDIDDVALSDPSDSIASVEKLSVTLDPLALLTQRIEPTRIVFQRPTIVLPDDQDAPALDLSGEAIDAGLQRLLRLAGTLDAGLRDAELVMSEATVVTASGRRFEGIRASLSRDDVTGRLTLEAEDDVRSLLASWERGTEESRLRIAMSSTAERFSFGRETRREVSLDDAVLRLDAVLADGVMTGEAFLRLAGIGPDDRTFSLAVPCRLTQAACRVADGRLDYGQSGATFAGRIGYRTELRGPARFDLASDDLRLHETDQADPVVSAELALNGQLLTDAIGIQIEHGRLRHGVQQADLRGRIALGERSPALDIVFETSAIEAAFAKQVWPRFLASGTRNWVLDHVSSARIGPIEARVSVDRDALHAAEHGQSLPTGAIAAAIPFANAYFDYVEGLPVIADAAGRISLDAAAASIVLSQGHGRLDQASPADIHSAAFRIADFRAKPPVAEIRASFSAGPDLVRALRGPLQSLGRAIPEGAAGAADVDLALRLPLMSDIPAEAVGYDVQANITGASVPNLYADHALEDGVLNLQANPAGFELSGAARLADLPTGLTLYGAAETGVESFSATLDADAKSLRALGIDVTTFLDGPISVSLAGNDPADGIDRLTVDFSGAEVTLPGRGRIKDRGVDATLVSNVRQDDESLSLTDIVVDATTFRARGRLDIAGDDDLTASLDAFVIGQDDRGRANIEKRGDSTSISVVAEALDARPVLTWLFASEGQGAASQSAGATTVEITADRVIGYRDQVLRNFSLQLDLDGARPALMAANASLNGMADVQASLRRTGGRGVLSVRSADAGRTLRFVDIYERVSGGELGIEANLADDGAAFGSLSISDFEIADETGLEMLTRDVDAENRASMAFDQLRIPFSHAGGRAKIGEGFIRGPVAGATFTGGLNLRQDTLDIRGTFVPLYNLNNVFSRVPVVGSILGGRRREGLWGITFAMDGPIAEPTLRVNPLSAIAPGMFRQIFEFAPSTD